MEIYIKNPRLTYFISKGNLYFFTPFIYFSCPHDPIPWQPSVLFSMFMSLLLFYFSGRSLNLLSNPFFPNRKMSYPMHFSCKVQTKLLVLWKQRSATCAGNGDGSLLGEWVINFHPLKLTSKRTINPQPRRTTPEVIFMAWSSSANFKELSFPFCKVATRGQQEHSTSSPQQDATVIPLHQGKTS